MVGCWRLVPGGMLLARVTVRYATYDRMLETCPRRMLLVRVTVRCTVDMILESALGLRYSRTRIS